jgi:hypothetical protein
MIDQMLAMSGAELRQTLAEGHRIDPAALDASRYRGVSLGLPAWVDRALWKTFEKDFRRDPDTGVLRGWNVRLEQTGLDGEVSPRLRNGAPWIFGHYEVLDRGDHLELDYGRGDNPRLDPSRLARDPLVAVHPGSVEWLFGATDVCLGRWRVRTPSYFLLQRLEATG